MSDINFQPPSNQYLPPLGEEIFESNSNDFAAGYNSGTYANPAQLIADLQTLASIASSLVSDLESDLTHFALPITLDPTDATLTAANRQEWPSALGAPASYVTYRYYKALASRDTASAIYIRQRFESAARDITGTNSIDLITPANIISDEVGLIQEFVSKNVGILSDSSEKRAVELFQDWTANATNHAGILRNLFEAGPATLPSTDADSVDPSDASNAQALFKVNVNKLNADLTQALALLQKNFSTYASTFYTNFLQPALNFRQNVTSNLTPTIPGVLGTEMTAAHNSIDLDMASILADQKRRNNVFDQQTTTIETTVLTRDKYRSYVIQLAATGTTVAAGDPGTLIQATDTTDQAATFTNLATQTNTDATPSFGAPHSLLSGLGDSAAHSQYLLKAGDTMAGDLLLADGVAVDGIRPHTHAHTGADGSAQIHGSDIVALSIGSGALDTTDTPTVPTNLRMVGSFTQIVPPGVTMTTFVLAWDTDNSHLSFEVQSVALV